MVNSGNANAFTGKSGRDACKFTAQIAARAAGCKPEDVFLASTGVIGEPLKAQAFDGVMEGMVARAQPGDFLGRGARDHDHRHVPEGRDRDGEDRQGQSHDQWHRQRRRHDRAGYGDDAVVYFHRRGDFGARAADASEGWVADTFNAVTIDGDTSTSDTLMMFATGKAHGAPRISRAADPRLKDFRKALHGVLADLSEQIARDGEGARKLVEIVVEGAVSKSSARRIAMSIANSPLVKTAIAGEDANWGRVVMAVGKAGEPADRDKLSIWFGGIRVAHKGARDPGYDEATVSAAMKKPEISLKVALGLGKGRDRVLTCDLTKEYVAINGDYRS